MKITNLVLIAGLALVSSVDALSLKERLARNGARAAATLDKPKATVKTTHYDSVDPETGAHLTTIQHASHVEDTEDPSERHVSLGTHINYRDPKQSIDKTVQTQHTSFTDKESNAKIERTQSTNTVTQTAPNKNVNQVHRVIHTQRLGSDGEILHTTEDIIRTKTVERVAADGHVEYLGVEYFDPIDQEYDGTHMLPPVDPLVNTFEQAVAQAPSVPQVPDVPSVASIGVDGANPEEIYYSADGPEFVHPVEPAPEAGGAEFYESTSVSVIEESVTVQISAGGAGGAAVDAPTVEFPAEALEAGSNSVSPSIVPEGALAEGALASGEVVVSGDRVVVAGSHDDHVSPKVVDSLDGGDSRVHAEIRGSVPGSETEADAVDNVTAPEEFFTFSPEQSHPVVVNDGAQLGKVEMVHKGKEDWIVPTTVDSVSTCSSVKVTCSEVPQVRVSGATLVKAGVWTDKKGKKHSEPVELDEEQTEYMDSEYVSAHLKEAKAEESGEEEVAASEVSEEEAAASETSESA